MTMSVVITRREEDEQQRQQAGQQQDDRERPSPRLPGEVRLRYLQGDLFRRRPGDPEETWAQKVGRRHQVCKEGMVRRTTATSRTAAKAARGRDEGGATVG